MAKGKSDYAWLGWLAILVVIVGQIMKGDWAMYSTAVALIYLIFRTL